MNREIKYRAFCNIHTYQRDKENHNWIPKEVMCEVSTLHLKKKTARVLYKDGSGNNCSTDVCLSKVTLLEYTGFKDKNGKEIYEGDILTSCHPIYDGGEPMRHKVVLLNGWWRLQDISDLVIDVPLSLYYNDDEDSTLEIIGNICDNTDLLIV